MPKREQALFIDAGYLFPFPVNIKENGGSTYRQKTRATKLLVMFSILHTRSSQSLQQFYYPERNYTKDIISSKSR